jgi:fructose-1,6-bisphosphatase/inositol monophosphatase family enzyme
VFSEEAEETGKSDDSRWIVDPIDGSAYFIFGEPYFSISIARERSGEIIEGHVYNPISNEYFYSDNKSESSYINGETIAVSEITRVEESLVAFGFSANIRAINRYYSDWKETFENCRKGIAWICPALSICNVARGRLEAFIDSGCSYQGQAAASLILRNAGGAMFNYDRTAYDHRVKGGIFTNGLFGG